MQSGSKPVPDLGVGLKGGGVTDWRMGDFSSSVSSWDAKGKTENSFITQVGARVGYPSFAPKTIITKTQTGKLTSKIDFNNCPYPIKRLFGFKQLSDILRFCGRAYPWAINPDHRTLIACEVFYHCLIAKKFWDFFCRAGFTSHRHRV